MGTKTNYSHKNLPPSRDAIQIAANPVLFLNACAYLLVYGELDGVRPWLRSEVVHSGLEALLPRVEVHRRQLALTHRGGRQEQKQK